MINIKNFSS